MGSNDMMKEAARPHIKDKAKQVSFISNRHVEELTRKTSN